MKKITFIFIFYISSAFSMELSLLKPKVDNEVQCNLYLAIVNNDFEGVKSAITNGAHINEPVPRTGETFLGVAIKKSTPAIVNLLLQKGADPNLAENKVTPIMHAVAKEKINAVQLLLNAKADLSQKDSVGKTVLERAQEKRDQADVYAEYVRYDDSIRESCIQSKQNCEKIITLIAPTTLVSRFYALLYKAAIDIQAPFLYLYTKLNQYSYTNSQANAKANSQANAKAKIRHNFCLDETV